MDEREKRTKAWVGDAVLSLFAREWILAQPDIAVEARSEEFKAMTSNRFLSSVGEPTAMEAEIGLAYDEGGVEGAFRLIEERFLPVFKKQRLNRRKQGNWRNPQKRSGRNVS